MKAGTLHAAALGAAAVATLTLNADPPGRLAPPGWISRCRAIARHAETWEGRPFRIAEAPLNDVREMVRRIVPAGTDVALVLRNPGQMDPTERAMHVAMAFERLPARVVPCSIDEVPDGVRWLVLPPSVRAETGAGLLDDGWERQAGVSSICSLWRMEETETAE